MKLKSNAVILFQGDSITDGGRGRTEDPNHILGHSYVFLIGSRLGADFPELGLEFINRMGKDAINYFTNGDDTWYTQLESMNRDKLLEIIEANVKKYKVTNWPDYCIW